MRTRVLGASLVVLSVIALAVLRAVVLAGPPQQPATTPELLLALLAVVAGLPGLGMVIEGPALFGYYEGPRRP